jgi:hypothetical protein
MKRDEGMKAASCHSLFDWPGVRFHVALSAFGRGAGFARQHAGPRCIFMFLHVFMLGFRWSMQRRPPV